MISQSDFHFFFISVCLCLGALALHPGLGQQRQQHTCNNYAACVPVGFAANDS
jgi:hypothetical protein